MLLFWFLRIMSLILLQRPTEGERWLEIQLGIWGMEVRGSNLTWPVSSIPSAQLPGCSAAHFLLCTMWMCRRNSVTDTNTICQVWRTGRVPQMWVKSKCSLLGGLKACFLWPASFKPEIFPLECSSGLLLLKPKPPPLYGLLEDPVFVFLEVMEPRCKRLYLWRQSLFLGRNSTLLGRDRHTACSKTSGFPPAESCSGLLINFMSFVPTQNSYSNYKLRCFSFLHLILSTVSKGQTFNTAFLKCKLCFFAFFIWKCW